MESKRKSPLEIREHNVKLLWSISDKWFRILEFSLILATLYYFKDRTENFFVSGIYWFSWIVFYMWFLEIGEYVSERISAGKQYSKSRNFLVWVLSMFPVLAIYTIITAVANSIMSAK